MYVWAWVDKKNKKTSVKYRKKQKRILRTLNLNNSIEKVKKM